MRTLAFCLCALFMLVSLSARAEWKGSEETVDGVLTIHNPATPAQGELVLKLKPLFSLGGESDDPNQLFGMVQQILVDEEHNTYLLDQQLHEIKVFDAKGEYLRTIGRKGEGPGEFNNPNAMFFLPGSRIGVSQMMPGRIAVLDEQGQGLDDYPIPGEGGFVLVAQVESAADRVVMQETVGSFTSGKVKNINRLLALDGSGKELLSYGEEVKEMDVSGGRMRINMGDETFAREWAVGPQGRVFAVNERTDYKIQVYGLDGRIERTIERDYEPLAFTDEEKAERKKRMDENSEAQGMDIDAELPDYKPDVQGLFVRPNGELWVRTSRSVGEDGGLGSFDVYDAQGHFQYLVKPQLAYVDSEDGFVLTKDRFYRIKELNGALKAWAAGFGGGIRIAVDTEDEDEDGGEPEPLKILAFELPLELSQMRK